MRSESFKVIFGQFIFVDYLKYCVVSIRFFLLHATTQIFTENKYLWQQYNNDDVLISI